MKESYMWVWITVKPFYFFLRLLGYQLSECTKFQKLPVSIVGGINFLMLLKMEAGSFQNVFRVVIIEKFLIN